MIHYHGGPITPVTAAMRVWRCRHAFISFAAPDQVEVAAEVCQSFALDNGAFSAWKAGKKIDWSLYYLWVEEWKNHPGFDFAVIPDVIDGDEYDNDKLLLEWRYHKEIGVPVWHLHESIHRLQNLCQMWPRVAFGSSGDYATIGTQKWHNRMAEAMNAICTDDGYPICKLHGLRMLDPKIFQLFPFSSADSTNIAQNIGIESKWRGTYTPATKETRAVVIAERVEQYNSAQRWERMPVQVDGYETVKRMA